jgi:transposase
VKALRAAFARKVASTWCALLDKLKFIDESGVNLGLTRAYGRATPGARVCEGTPGISGRHYTLIAALHLQGVSAMAVVDDAMDREAFEVYVQRILAPTLRPGDIVVLDNLSAHKGGQIQSLIESRGARLAYLPPYSSDWNPIELCWSKVKAILRTAKARTFDALWAALRKAFAAVTPADVVAWFAHCGYAINS